MNEATVTTEIDQRGVARLWLNRADKHNAFDDAVIAELDTALEALAQDSNVRVVILGSAGKSFSAGADLPTSTSSAAWCRRLLRGKSGGRPCSA